MLKYSLENTLLVLIKVLKTLILVLLCIKQILIIVVKIISNSGNGSYKVRRRGESWYCQCKGFYFRKHCSHIDEAKRLSEIQLEKLTN